MNVFGSTVEQNTVGNMEEKVEFGSWTQYALEG